MFQTYFHRIHAFLVVLGCLDWLEGKPVDDEFHGLISYGSD